MGGAVFGFFSGTLSSARRCSLLLIAVRPRNSTIRCLLLYFPNTPALPFTMVAPVPAQITTLRLHPRAAAPRRPLLTTHHSLRTLFLLPVATGVYSRHSRRQAFSPSGMPTLLFASTCRLFALSFHSFLHSFPLFSIVCSLFSENTRGGGASSRSIVSRNPRFMTASISLRINTCKSVSKQTTLTPFRMNTCEKRGEGGTFIPLR